MKKILISGLINIETTLKIERFPLDYFPVTYSFFGVNSSVSGVGYNLAKALTTLQNKVHFLSLIGAQDIASAQVRAALAHAGIADQYVLSQSAYTAQSVILYDPSGRRQIHTDLKDLQDQTYPVDLFRQTLAESDLTALCNINFSRPFLQIARQSGKIVATDIHAVSSLEDDYNRDFMSAAQILFMSNERLPDPPEVFARKIQARHGTEILVIGLGAQGALLCTRKDHFMERIPAVSTRPIVNTIGAGDALFSAFIHTYAHTQDPLLAVQKAVVFASYKIGAVSAADGFLDADALDRLYAEKFSPA